MLNLQHLSSTVRRSMSLDSSIEHTTKLKLSVRDLSIFSTIFTSFISSPQFLISFAVSITLPK
ncbi:hypothetical protein Lalb_Chr01g0004001 [Lupinus albus]|uniref:Uncharacterized protein n=1 Tax=Lupinus albus TaxID=3870 RepID=A0A6A4R3A7_LUPAL|nr:hypothetical protein Lalb_Chr01g0004001 [Lupinus albus]